MNVPVSHQPLFFGDALFHRISQEGLNDFSSVVR